MILHHQKTHDYILLRRIKKLILENIQKTRTERTSEAPPSIFGSTRTPDLFFLKYAITLKFILNGRLL